MNYIDLGLPSGILWADCNIGADKPTDNGKYFNLKSAQNLGTLPTCEQWEELKQHCKLLWNLKEEQLEIVGPNNNCIVLPAAGYHDGTSPVGVNEVGYYWSVSSFNKTQTYSLRFCSYSFGLCTLYYSSKSSVRLVKNR